MADRKWFEKFNEKLNIDEEDIEEIEYILNKVSEIINYEYKNQKAQEKYTFLTGSVARETLVDVENIDIVAVLPEYIYRRYALNGEIGIYQIVESFYKNIKKTFIYSSISKSGSIVIVNQRIKFNIIPAFKEEDGTYTYPDILNNKWINFDIEKSLSEFKERDEKYNGNMKNFAKMIKIWNKQNKVNLSEILIDSMVYEFFENYTFGEIRGFSYYDYYFYDFFKDILKKGVEYYWYIPGVDLIVKPRSPYYLNKKAEISFEIVKKAMGLYIEDLNYLAKDEWIKLLGEDFI